MLLSSFVGREEAEKRGEKLPCFFTKTLAKRERTILSSIRLRLCLSPLFFFFPSPLPHLYSSKMKRSCLFSPIFLWKILSRPFSTLLKLLISSFPRCSITLYFIFPLFPSPLSFPFFPLFPFFFLFENLFVRVHSMADTISRTSWNIKGRTRLHLYKQR